MEIPWKCHGNIFSRVSSNIAPMSPRSVMRPTWVGFWTWARFHIFPQRFYYTAQVQKKSDANFKLFKLFSFFINVFIFYIKLLFFREEHAEHTVEWFLIGFTRFRIGFAFFPERFHYTAQVQNPAHVLRARSPGRPRTLASGRQCFLMNFVNL